MIGVSLKKFFMAASFSARVGSAVELSSASIIVDELVAAVPVACITRLELAVVVDWS
jgi:hypothetical protein